MSCKSNDAGLESRDGFREDQMEEKINLNIDKIIQLICAIFMFSIEIVTARNVILSSGNTIEIKDDNLNEYNVSIAPLNEKHAEKLKSLGFPTLEEKNIPIIRGMMFLQDYFFDFPKEEIDEICNTPITDRKKDMMKNFSEEYKNSFDRLLTPKKGKEVYVIFVKKEEAGFILIEEKELNIYVHHNFRGKNAALLAIETYLTHKKSKAIELAVHPNNAAMRHIMKKLTERKIVKLGGGYFAAADSLDNELLSATEMQTILDYKTGKKIRIKGKNVTPTLARAKDIRNINIKFLYNIHSKGIDGDVQKGQLPYICCIFKHGGGEIAKPECEKADWDSRPAQSGLFGPLYPSDKHPLSSAVKE